MEPHMLSALLPSAEHFIQIGDHQQLRPQINNYGLSLESQQGLPYQLDRSQFERLSVGEQGRPTFPVAQLNVQRRMRPEISCLIRETIYPRLIDHETTKHLPDVIGMRKNVFWLEHDNLEASQNEDRHQRSHSKSWEVEMTHALVRHIVRQGVYSASDIAVLTPYTGQLQRLRAEMRNNFEIVLSDRDEDQLLKEGLAEETPPEGNRVVSGSGRKPLEKKKLSEMLRLATVDNFQGEEAKIIIVSLVRSNKEKKVGFLRTTNRINVLLSRAQHGMYIIGNAETYANITMWAKVLQILKSSDSIGTALSLCCPRHNDTDIKVSQPIDFEALSPEGGCQLPCDRRLPECGHRCQAKCHSESMHTIFECQQPCQRLHSPCNHGCQKPTCADDCGRCMIKLDNILLPCSHLKDNVPCYKTQNLGSIHCSVRVEKQVPGCGHMVTVNCSLDVRSSKFSCPKACESDLICGHRCPGTCGQCYMRDSEGNPVTKHLKCTKECGRRLKACNHICKRSCHIGEVCGPCFSACEVRCSHSRCTLHCHQSCAPCVEKCTWSCEHRGDCDMPCAAACRRLRCNRRCSKTLSCGHQCPGICGEICRNDYCHVCSGKGDAQVDLFEMKSYGEIDPSETPIVVLGCGHFYTAETLDGHIGMAEVYKMDSHGEFTGFQDVSATLARSIPCCPYCQCRITQYYTKRYNRVINRAVLDEMAKRFILSGKEGLQDLEQQITELEEGFQAIYENVLRSNQEAKSHIRGGLKSVQISEIAKLLQTRFKEAKKLDRTIHNFCKTADDKYQPAQKLHEATVHAARKTGLDQQMAVLSVNDTIPSVPCDHQITMGGRMASLKIGFLTLESKFKMRKILKSTPSGASIDIPDDETLQLSVSFFSTCKQLIDACDTNNLPKLSVEGRLLYTAIACAFQSFVRSANKDFNVASTYRRVAKELIGEAEKLCQRPFGDSENLRHAVERAKNALEKEWYEEVTAEEIVAIKSAMVSGSNGIVTHSGHWYNCENGHPFVIGECGMPMEVARCPECGARVGGQHHDPLEGVTRAINMED